MRWTSSLFLVLSLGLSLFAAEPKDPKTLDVSAENLKAAKALIAKLDDDDILVRDKLTAELKAMGRDALPALLDAQKAKVPNRVLDRVMEVLPAARQADFATRYPVFLADKDRKYDHDLPGWNELKVAVRDTKESRALMADILNDDECRDMLHGAMDRGEEGRKRFEGRWERKHLEWRAECRAGRQPEPHRPKADAPIHWLVATLLADLLYDRDYLNYKRGPVLESYYFADEGKLAAAGKGKYGAVVRDFAVSWIESQKEPLGMMDATWLAKAWKFDEAFVWRCVEREFECAVALGNHPRALSQLAWSKNPKYIAMMRKVFDCDTPFFPTLRGGLPEVQVRDAALAMCISLSGQDPVDYGFSSQSKATTDDVRFSTQNYYLTDGDGKSADEKRKAAFKKWGEWEKANPDAIKAKPPEKK